MVGRSVSRRFAGLGKIRTYNEEKNSRKDGPSAFYGTPFEFLADELQVTRLVLAGIEADICGMYTAHDAYMRKFKLWIPRNCVASRSSARLNAALEFMRVNLKAETRPFTGRLGNTS